MCNDHLCLGYPITCPWTWSSLYKPLQLISKYRNGINIMKHIHWLQGHKMTRQCIITWVNTEVLGIYCAAIRSLNTEMHGKGTLLYITWKWEILLLLNWLKMICGFLRKLSTMRNPSWKKTLLQTRRLKVETLSFILSPNPKFHSPRDCSYRYSTLQM